MEIRVTELMNVIINKVMEKCDTEKKRAAFMRFADAWVDLMLLLENEKDS